MKTSSPVLIAYLKMVVTRIRGMTLRFVVMDLNSTLSSSLCRGLISAPPSSAVAPSSRVEEIINSTLFRYIRTSLCSLC
ncbi:hypothetical protein RIF29_06999 [Crotalaria pallida]|uniref:Uncharacterized protein n=1 Tax=Crotalaria pallida TaxID=3830 RepID=A0AAN9J3R8_CROPI